MRAQSGKLRAQHKRAADQAAIRDGKLEIGKHSYGIPNISYYRGDGGRVVIGSFCSISPEVEIIPGGIHPPEWVSTFPFRIRWTLQGAYEDGTPRSKGVVVIGSDVWIGTRTVILSGVRIGDGAIIGAGAVVASDVPPYAVVHGNPARVVRMRFEPTQIEELLRIRWWEWPDDRILDAVESLSSDRVEDFIQAFGTARELKATGAGE